MDNYQNVYISKRVETAMKQYIWTRLSQKDQEEIIEGITAATKIAANAFREIANATDELLQALKELSDEIADRCDDETYIDEQ